MTETYRAIVALTCAFFALIDVVVLCTLDMNIVLVPVLAVTAFSLSSLACYCGVVYSIVDEERPLLPAVVHV